MHGHGILDGYVHARALILRIPKAGLMPIGQHLRIKGRNLRLFALQ